MLSLSFWNSLKSLWSHVLCHKEPYLTSLSLALEEIIHNTENQKWRKWTFHWWAYIPCQKKKRLLSDKREQRWKNRERNFKGVVQDGFWSRKILNSPPPKDTPNLQLLTSNKKTYKSKNLTGKGKYSKGRLTRYIFRSKAQQITVKFLCNHKRPWVAKAISRKN